jgi:hypothetical protein
MMDRFARSLQLGGGQASGICTGEWEGQERNDGINLFWFIIQHFSGLPAAHKS